MDKIPIDDKALYIIDLEIFNHLTDDDVRGRDHIDGGSVPFKPQISKELVQWLNKRKNILWYHYAYPSAMYSHLLTLEYEFQLCVKSTGKYQRFTKNLYTYYGPEMIQEFRS